MRIGTYEEFEALIHAPCGKPLGEHNYYGIILNYSGEGPDILCERRDREAIYDVLIEQQTKDDIFVANYLTSGKKAS